MKTFTLERTIWLAAIVASCLLGGLAYGQSQPQVAFVFPPGGQQGKTVEIAVRGRFLMGATGVHISGKGVVGTLVKVEQPAADKKQPRRLDVTANPDRAIVQVTVDPSAAVGERDLRLITPGGISNRFRFYVSQATEVTENEPNSTPQEAQEVPALPVVINGQIAQGDRDIFRFKARAGQTLVLDVYAQKILPYIADGVPGWFQPTLTLYDGQGREIAYVDEFRQHPDPLLIYKVEKDGEFMVEIKDALYRGRDEFVYRLNIGEMPHITHMFPLGGPRNAKTNIKLFGVNLPVQETVVDLTGEKSDRRAVQVSSSGLVSNAMPFAVSDLPEVMENEANDTLDKAQRVEAPVVINGRINRPGDADYYIFSVKAKQTLVMQVHARRLDSPLDAILTLYNAKGGQMLENDDTVDKSEGLVTHHADSYLTYTFPAAGDYVLRIADTEGKGGEEYGYRLTVAPPQPDYVLRVRPDNLRTPQGGTTFFNVLAFRRDGFDGPIKLKMDNLPSAFTIPEDVIPEKQTETRMTISTPADVPLGILAPRVVGTAKIGDKDVVRVADPSEDQMQAFYYMHNVPTREMLLAVIEKGPFTFTLDLPRNEALKVPRLGRVTLNVKVSFKEGVKPGPITLRCDRIPREWAIETPPIPAGETQTTLTFTTSGNMAVFAGQRGTLIITAIMRSGNTNISGFVPAIPYEVVQ